MVVRRRAPVVAGATFPAVVPDAPDFEAQEAARRAERLTGHWRPQPEEDGVDFSLAAGVCGGSFCARGKRLSCQLCSSSPCQVGCTLRDVSHGQQALYEWLVAKRSGYALRKSLFSRAARARD